MMPDKYPVNKVLQADDIRNRTSVHTKYPGLVPPSVQQLW
jgi:hypothetical protein